MANDSVSVILGIGKIISKALENHGVTTVGQLANLEAGEISIASLPTLIGRAKEYLKVKGGSEPPAEPVVILGAKPSATKSKETNHEDPQQQQTHNNTYLVTDHTWWELTILIPREYKNGETLLKEAVIYEMSIEPHERISMVCSWIDQTEERPQEKLCSMTYSPQILLYFNETLPDLNVTIREADFKKLPNQHTLANVLQEVSTMKKWNRP